MCVIHFYTEKVPIYNQQECRSSHESELNWEKIEEILPTINRRLFVMSVVIRTHVLSFDDHSISILLYLDGLIC